MDEKLNEVCRELDRLALQVLKLSEEQIKCRVKLEEMLKPGFVHIAKSRYIMGNKSVSALQLPTEDSPDFKALATVQSERRDNDEGFPEYTLTQTDVGEKANSDKRNPKSGLKQRKVEEGRKSGQEEEDDSITQTDSDDKKDNILNPLKWFGVLVPQNLRMAQNVFQSSLPVVVECANIQNQLLSTQKEYKRLLAVKATLS